MAALIYVKLLVCTEKQHLPMSRGDLADYLGPTIETVSRSLSQLRRDGVIQLDQANEIALLKPQGLFDLASAL